MNLKRNAILTALFSIALVCLAARPAAAASIGFDVVVNTAPLAGNPAGPFSLDFQLIGAGPNSVSLSNFQFFGGSAVGSASAFGTASGNLMSGITLNDSSTFFNEIFQQFTPGSQLRFSVSMTTNLTPTPDAFSFAILDNTLSNIPTNGLGDALFLFNIRPTGPVSDLQTFRPTGAGLTSITVTAVPEPSSATLLLTGVAAIALWLRRRPAIRRS